MGTSALPSSGSPPSPFTDWFTSDYLLTQALTRELSCSSSSTSSSSSSSSPALHDSSDFTAFLHRNPLDSLHSQAPVGSPVISCNSFSIEKPESPFYPSCVSAMSNLSSPSTRSSAPQHLPKGFNQLANSIFKPSEENSPSCITSLLSAADAAASITLSSSRSVGGGATKVSKRRTRMNKKAPIAVLSADATNFRAMVQQLTGIPTSHNWASSGAPLLRPQATRVGYMPTLDTSAGFLSSKQMLPFLQGAPQPLTNGLLSGGAISNNGEGLASFGGRCNMGNHSTFLSHGLWDTAKSLGNLPKGNVKELLATNLVKGGEQASPMQSSTLLERYLMSDDTQSPHGNVDSWLVFDGGVLANHS